MILKIEAREETGLFEDFSHERFDNVEAAVAAINEFYGPNYTGGCVHVLDIENVRIVWANYNRDPNN